VSRDLLPEAAALQGVQVAIWVLIGAGAFMTGDRFVDRKFGSEETGGALGIVVGSGVDGVPESIIFGIQLARGTTISVAFLTAVFVSNVPHALAPSAGRAGESGRRCPRDAHRFADPIRQ
jgi:ZIP family zinc transporter